ncbi:unnamed protein product [Tilletia laevis]|nr:hypothetical protein CF335_g7990 [Tilletia laevis]KAE8242811.1 hypothetical protein A4X03_0g7963 [Tilletia caries]KAE8192887.1 hypothetical protein CF336_g4235 [Tilletia laevis]CAD6888290.1 unnamed protein product [Tilletia caries]CAD6916845.1 unnamed protein product [Tilletia laevis]
MTPNAAAFASTKPDSTSVVTASGKHLRSIGRGTVTLQINSPNPGILALLDVLLVPELEFSLISVYKLNEDHLRVEFTEHLEAVISDPFQRDFIVSAPWSAASQAYLILAIGDTERSKASALVTTTNEERSGTQLSQRDLQEILWHERTGHMGKTRLPLLYEVSRGLPELLAKRYHLSNSQCWVCYLTNLRRLPFPNSTTKSTRALELVHADLTGRIIVKSFGGAEYLAILVDDFTRMVWVLPLAKKSDFVSAFIK